MRNNEIIRAILAERTGQDPERIRLDTDRDFYLNAQQALEYGLIDEVLQRPGDVGNPSENGTGN